MKRLAYFAVRLRNLLSFYLEDSVATVDRMKRDWEMRAHENARHYVATCQREWSDVDFSESGRLWVEYYILPDMDFICRNKAPSKMHILEIGCGAGRMTKSLTDLFGFVDATSVKKWSSKPQHS